MFFKKDKKLELTIQDLDYIYQYIVLKYENVKFYKNVFFMIMKTKTEFFDFISMLNKDYLKKSSLIYITGETQHNQSIFSKDTNEFLNYEINSELIEYLKIKIQNGRIFEKIDTEYNGLFLSKSVVFFVFVIVLFWIIHILWNQFTQIKAQTWGGMNINMDSVFFFYENNLVINLFLFSIVFWLMIMKYIKHFPFMEFWFSKYYLLLKYKEKLYTILLKYYIEKKWKRGEIWYLNTKLEFLDIYHSIFQYLSDNEISEVLFFVENDEVEISLKNPILKQDLILDYKNYQYIQNNNIKEKMNFFHATKEKNYRYYELLKLNYENEIEKLKGYMNLKGLFLYIIVTLIVVLMIGPILISAL